MSINPNGNKITNNLKLNFGVPREKLMDVSSYEKKQHEMRLELGDEKLEYKIADVRDRERINEVMRGIDYVFHSAALKHVPACEYDPYEAVKTNILGTNNVLVSSINKFSSRLLISIVVNVSFFHFMWLMTTEAEAPR